MRDIANSEASDESLEKQQHHHDQLAPKIHRWPMLPPHSVRTKPQRFPCCEESEDYQDRHPCNAARTLSYHLDRLRHRLK